MTRLNRDAVIAVLLLILCGVLFWQTFFIREVPFSQIGSEVWPRAVLILLAVLALIYLFTSLSEPRPENAPFCLKSWLKAYKNPLICFAMFFVFLLALPYLGMLLAGILFVFITQTLVGGASPRRVVTHAVVSILSVGGMWAIFTYALRVILPAGELFH
ncbi:MAG: tripartite tricarboxylate transporter TctB family protein [Burkholderiaceae bacterium]|nr:tripartite tricarboxylate transporter TctB family protein [Burkholderiaceae bacterium]